MTPIWHAIAREAALAAEHLGSGATILGKANYAHHAHYGQAFFDLTTGIERATKLAFVVDHAIENHGSYPTHSELRDFGHNLALLIENADAISARRGFTDARMPRSDIHQGIVEVLSDFASNLTRYYNLDFLTGDPRAATRVDPTQGWYDKVVVRVLKKHYTQKHQEQHKRNAAMISALTQDFTRVLHFSEGGETLDTVYSASLQTGTMEFAKPYVRMYVLQIARFLGRLLANLGYEAGSKRLDIPHLPEFFAIFNNDDKYFFSRKSWSIYRP